jgi:hypothetical protein
MQKKKNGTNMLHNCMATATYVQLLSFCAHVPVLIICKYNIYAIYHLFEHKTFF